MDIDSENIFKKKIVYKLAYVILHSILRTFKLFMVRDAKIVLN